MSLYYSVLYSIGQYLSEVPSKVPLDQEKRAGHGVCHDFGPRGQLQIHCRAHDSMIYVETYGCSNSSPGIAYAMIESTKLQVEFLAGRRLCRDKTALPQYGATDRII